MTNHWIDLQNCKTILVEGRNVAENHPMAFKWIRKAQENGAKIIHVDPRFTRTSAAADIYARIRPGTDAAFQNTMINYILVNKLYDEDYVVTHTNALFLGDESFDFKDGVFSGFDAENHKYHTETWGYQLDAKGKPRLAKSLDDPHCVFARLKNFVSRYTLETGEQITGVPAHQIQQIAETMAKNRPGSILYALGMTQHTTGVQGIRSFTILQLLLGNIGKPGGGVNALRGEPNVQGACDMAVLYNYMPGYLNSASNAEPTIHDYVRKNGIADSRYLVNTLKAFYGEAATAENDYAYAWLPKRNASKDYGTLPMLEDALAGKLKLLWIVGQNPAVTVPNLKLTFDALANLETLVVQEIWETETAAFWRRPGVDPNSISTEVILLPAAFFMEKNGTISNSGGMVQWRHAAVKPPGLSKSDGEIVDLVFRKVRDQVKDSKEPRDQIVQKAFWTYTTAEDVLREINGYALRDNPETGLKAGDMVRKVSDLRADGSTSSGAWIYAGIFANGENLSKRRDSRSDPGGLGLYPGFGWTWPNNMRILYNRASCDRNGKPYPGSKPIVWWDEQAKRWTGYDVPDVPVLTDGPATPNGQRAFHLGAEGVGRLFAAVYSDPDEKHPGYPRDVAYVPKDGPLPEMYEPVESPVENILHPSVSSNPMLKYPRVATYQPIGTVDKYPYVLMTSTVAEHWCGGSTTRSIPWLNELIPEPVLEMPITLGQKLGVKSGDWVRVWSARGELEVKALVTPRVKELQIGDRQVTAVWMPYNWGFQGLSTGPSVNHITIDAADPGAGDPGDQGVPRQRGQGRPLGGAKRPIPREAHMTNAVATGPIRATLIDITNCIGCRACQVACKQWNERDGEQTELEAELGFQNPATLSSKTYTLIAFHEMENPQKPGGLESAFVMQRCLHCLEPACASACPTTALYRQSDGPVTYEVEKCIGCRYCLLACPWDVPTAEWNTRAPKISKCTHCADRADQPVPIAFNGMPLSDALSKQFTASIATPACVKACPADALRYGTRDEMLTIARKRISDRPDKYVDHIYGEKELGGTSVMYLSAVPFERLGFPTYGEKPFPAFTRSALGAVPPAVMAVGALLGATYAFFRKRVQAAADGSAASKHAADHGHVEFEVLQNKLMTPFNWVLLLLIGFGLVSLVARFALGLGGSTNLSNTYPWGLWILFDLVWIAVAAGAFAMAGVIYVFQRKDLYGLGRTAVLTGLLSYSFVMVTLLADLGLPWHSYQLALQAPGHSAMFEVSWCVGLYVTILLFEFLPVPFEHWGFQRAAAAWRRWNGAYVAGVVTLFVFLLSRNLMYAAVAAAIFGALAWIFRARDQSAEPIMLAIAAVTLSTMHQSSLGSLYLLMPNMLAPQWWSPVMPVYFFLSSIVAGTALVVLIDMWIAKGWHRPLQMTRLASVGRITFWALLVYLVFRLGDMTLRNQISGAFAGKLGMAFAAEILLGGVLPLVLLARKSLRRRSDVLFLGALLAVLGVTYNRMNVVLFAMTFRGRMPWRAPEAYAPSIVEWGISIGLIAATIFLFGLAARYLPVLSQPEPSEAHLSR